MEWATDHLEIKGLFSNALPPETDRIYMRLSSVSGLSDAFGQLVKLVKSPYRLKQAPKL